MGKRKRGNRGGQRNLKPNDSKTDELNPSEPESSKAQEKAAEKREKASEAPAAVNSQPHIPSAAASFPGLYNPSLNPQATSSSQFHMISQAQTPSAPIKRPGPYPSQYPVNMSREKVISGILKNPPLMGLDAALEEVKPKVTNEFVEEVLKLSYGAGMETLKFFKWASWKLQGKKHTPYAWNILVDLLGKDKLFDAMWDCIKVMKTEGILSMETFSSVFGSYVSAGKIEEATMTFEVIEKYGCPQDVIALNCLLSAMCRYNQTAKAQECFDRCKEKIKPDADSYAVLLEGWEKEGNVKKARLTFGEMIIRVGWVPSNNLAYNAFLNTLINGEQGDEALKFLTVMKSRKCFPDLPFFCSAIDGLRQRRDTKNAYGFWELMRQGGIVPDTRTYNIMIDVFCSAKEFDSAYRLLDEMVFNGMFPNFKTYNTIFEALISNRRIDEASSIFREMTKNECYPLYENYVMAIKMYFEADDPEMAVTMWKQMILKGVAPKADCAAAIIGGFCDLKRVSEARKYCKESINRGIQVPSETMIKLRDILVKEGRKETYEQLEKKMKSLASQPKQ
ncbi:hypothetical protein SUGI_0493060 [Cryptomeria japonica]|uniref:pentatricopeptide repeat-containing protein At1g77360, mitochondrial n=1 Tax=Cryptomeria japonica TaxID=3369 RepID=UPI002408AFEE|nr:pentatricopeptide repeat-containing protein At1g77360, mitochondrial [Cryptomeria japonica]GLJ25753.1 hypothetical protein SUGI_0493060 [Cryptomeria japonica]